MKCMRLVISPSKAARNVLRRIPAMSSSASEIDQKIAKPPSFPDSEVLLISSADTRKEWADSLRAAGLKVKVYDDEKSSDLSSPAALENIELAISSAVYKPADTTILRRCPNLKAVQSTGAGVDKMILIPDYLPRTIPLLRLIDPLMAERMATWVTWAVINIQRKCDAYYLAQQASTWDKDIENNDNIDNEELRIGVMGLGVMGMQAAKTLASLNYPVYGWTRTQHTNTNSDNNGIKRCYHGKDQLADFASNVDIVVCLLPLTSETQGILNRPFFNVLPKGASIINAARGGHLIVDDLISALDDGTLSNAVLDVFDPEPIPEQSQMWKHPKIRIFPHVSSMTPVLNAVRQIMGNREAVLRGKLPSKELIVDYNRGY